MADKNRSDRDTTKNKSGTDRDLQVLLQNAGRRRQPDTAMRERVYASTLAEWQALPRNNSATSPSSAQTSGWWRSPHPVSVKRASVKRAPVKTALAATVLAVVSVLIISQYNITTEQPASLLFAHGDYQMQEHPPEVVTAGSGRLSLQLASGVVMRVDGNTRLRLESAHAVHLHTGRIYVLADSASGRHITVQTPHGSVSDLGTLFEVAANGSELTVAVREGTVNIESGNASIIATADDGHGDRVTISADHTERSQVATAGEYWNWLAETRPPFNYDEATIYDYLHWIAQSRGLTLVLRPVVEQQAKIQRVHLPARADISAMPVEDVLETSTFRRQPGAAHQLVVDFAL